MPGGADGFDCDVLIVGAGPTGLTLARELRALGVSVQLVDRAPDAVHESRALAIQARTLEVLARNGLADDLVAAGNPSGTLLLHGGRRRRGPGAVNPGRAVPLFDEALRDTRYPFLLFLSQAHTERILVERLASIGVGVGRGLTLTGLDQDADGVTCTLGSAGIPPRTVRARYVVGCDGAHSDTRRLAGIAFRGRAFPQRFLLADLEVDGIEVDGIEPGRVHVYLAAAGPLFLFPLGSPASWRLLVMLPPNLPSGRITLEVLQSTVDRYTGDQLRLHDPVWLTEFTISSRLAAAFQRGRVLLAGDAAHIHSPAGAQGMNTGIQDAVNLAWKLALVCRGTAAPALLGSYTAERMPVARSVLAMTDRAFRVATSPGALARRLRAGLAARAAAAVLRSRLARTVGFRLISQLSIHYRRSPLSVEGRPRLRHGPRAGERFPQPGLGPARAGTVGTAGTAGTAGRPVFRMVLIGPAARWPAAPVRQFAREWAHLVTVERRDFAPRSRWSAAPRPRPGARRYRGTAQYLLRWDGYVGYRAEGTDLAGATAYLHSLAGS